jgi:hypothetical protein
MPRTQQITHKGKIIFQMDFTSLNNVQEIQNLINESIRYIRSQTKDSVLTLTIISGMHFSNEIKDMFSKFMEGNKPYVKAGAVVGIGGLQQIVYNGLMKITGRDIKSFSTDDLAKDWLAGKN